MAHVNVVSVRLTVCPRCGREDRLITETTDEILSHCYACGDRQEGPRVRLPVAEPVLAGARAG